MLNFSVETSAELPHFSSPHLVNKYALIENLDFLYYLQHGRPSFAYGIFVIQHLADSSSVKLQWAFFYDFFIHLQADM